MFSSLKSKITKQKRKEQTIKDGIYEVKELKDVKGNGDIISFIKTPNMVNINSIFNIMRKQGGPIRRIIVDKERISVEFLQQLTVMEYKA